LLAPYVLSLKPGTPKDFIKARYLEASMGTL
jgi:hypothetical protein